MLIKRGKCKKLINRNLNLIWKTRRMIAEPNRKKKDASFFLARTQPIKSHGLFAYYSPPNFLFPVIKVS